MLAGEPEFRHEVVHRDEHHVVFLDRYPTLLGKLLVAPVEHREDVIGDFAEQEAAALWRLVHRTGGALRQVVPTERIYVQSLGSNSGNSHVHIHVAALPPGVPYEEQQTAALEWRSAGLLEVPAEETRRIAGRLRIELAAPALRAHLTDRAASGLLPERRSGGAAEPAGGSGMISGWSTVSSTLEYTGLRVVVRRDTVRRADRSTGTYEYTESVDGVRVVALDGRGRIALVEENVYVGGKRLLMCPGGY